MYDINTRASLNDCFKRTYAYMAIALLVTFAVSIFTADHFAAQIIQLGSSKIVLVATVVAQLGLVFLINRAIQNSNAKGYLLWFVIFTLFEGVVLSPLFLFIPMKTILLAFVSTSVLFATLSAIAFTTKLDMSRFLPVLIGGTIAMIIASVINIFLQADTLQLIISLISILLFSGWTLRDNQYLKQIFQNAQKSDLNRLAVSGALSLYIDFLNLFVNLLSILDRFNQ